MPTKNKNKNTTNNNFNKELLKEKNMDDYEENTLNQYIVDIINNPHKTISQGKILLQCIKAISELYDISIAWRINSKAYSIKDFCSSRFNLLTLSDHSIKLIIIALLDFA